MLLLRSKETKHEAKAVLRAKHEAQAIQRGTKLKQLSLGEVPREVRTGKHLKPGYSIGSFDILHDGRQILFGSDPAEH